MSDNKSTENESKILTLAEGQVWHYNARTGEKKSTLTINRIDPDTNHKAIYLEY